MTSLTDNEKAVLSALAKGYSTATHWLSVPLGNGNNTAKTRRFLKRLESKGLVQGISATQSFGGVRWWKITDEGRSQL